MLTIEEFSKKCGKSVRTVRKNIKNIKGVECIDGDFVFPESCRYPYFKPSNIR